MSLPPVILCTTVPYKHSEKTVARQDFQTELLVINMTCEEFLATPHITLVYAKYNVLYEGRHGENNHNIFHCRDGLVQKPVGSDSYFKLPGPSTDPATGRELRYKAQHHFEEADVRKALEELEAAQPPLIVYTGESPINIQGLSFALISATMEELLTKDMLILTVYKECTWLADCRKSYLYYTHDDKIAVCTSEHNAKPAFVSLEDAIDQDIVAAFRANPRAG